MQYPIIAQPQYGFAPTMPTFEGGGRVGETYGLRNAAEQLRERGRDGDTILAHINPEEAGILKLMGGSGTINPYTGLPEYSLRKVLKRTPIVKDIYKAGSSIGKEIERGVEKVAQNKYLGPIAKAASMLHPATAFLYAGLAPQGSSFDVKGGAKSAALSFGLNELKTAMSAPQGGYGPDFNPDPFGPGGDPTSFADYSGAGGPGGFGPGGFDAGGYEGVPGMDPVPGRPPFSFSDPLAGQSPIAVPESGIGESLGDYVNAGTNTVADGVPAPAPAPSAPTGPYDMGEGLEVMNQPSSGPADYSGEPGAGPDTANRGISPDTRSAFRQGYDAVKQGYADIKQGIGSLTEPITQPITDLADEILPGGYRDVLSTAKDVALVGGAASTAYSAYEMKKELDRQKDEADRIMQDKENRKQEEIAWAQGVIRDYPTKYERLTAEQVAQEQGMARGGIASLAKGGLPPRYLRGGGDGMSDSIPARIAGKQEARLADGEFVVPADVVSHLGNGSSNAGAKKLYAMMDRARKARTGKTSQAPEVNTRRLMPA